VPPTRQQYAACGCGPNRHARHWFAQRAPEREVARGIVNVESVAEPRRGVRLCSCRRTARPHAEMMSKMSVQLQVPTNVREVKKHEVGVLSGHDVAKCPQTAPQRVKRQRHRNRDCGASRCRGSLSGGRVCCNSVQIVCNAYSMSSTEKGGGQWGVGGCGHQMCAAHRVPTWLQCATPAKPMSRTANSQAEAANASVQAAPGGVSLRYRLRSCVMSGAAPQARRRRPDPVPINVPGSSEYARASTPPFAETCQCGGV